MVDYIAPDFTKDAFHCPYCHVYAHQDWYNRVGADQMTAPGSPSLSTTLPEYYASQCAHCKQVAMWRESSMVVPLASIALVAAHDMPDDVCADFNEARDVLAASPRASAALLRLALQKLCKHLGQKGENINEDIGNLVKQGLPLQVQKAMDIVRIVGNNAVHPAELDVRDDQQTALKLFVLINMIVDEMITRPAELDALFKGMPQGARDQVERRDKGN